MVPLEALLFERCSLFEQRIWPANGDWVGVKNFAQIVPQFIVFRFYRV